MGEKTPNSFKTSLVRTDSSKWKKVETENSMNSKQFSKKKRRQCFEEGKGKGERRNSAAVFPTRGSR
ncbi:hypothetical protein AAC387_Pa03g2064 [Persea americana]